MKLFLLLISIFYGQWGFSQKKVDSIFAIVSDHLPTTFYCDNKLCNGSVISYYENGQVKAKGKFRKGRPKRVKEYFDNGCLKSEQIYLGGRLHVSVSYTSEGSIYRRLNPKKRTETIYIYGSSKMPVKKIEVDARDYNNVVETVFLKVNDKWVRQN